METSAEQAEHLRRSIGEFVRATRATADALPESQAATLGYLDREGESTIAQLARLRGVRHQSMRITVEELERLGFVERRPDPDDARSFLIRLTLIGHQTLDGERRLRSASIAAAIDREFSAEERADLGRLSGLLDRLTTSITSS